MGEKQFSITIDEEKQLVRVVARGEVNRELGHGIVSKSLLTAANHQCNILCDVRDATIRVSLADWFYMPRMLSVFKDPKVHTVVTALLIAPGKQESDYKFYETVVHNLGMNFKIFTNEKDALEWLSAAR